MNIAIIPARGGSKRIRKKNIRPFLGKPIISYSIEVELESKLFDRVLVSTDDREIAEVASNFSAEVPFERPAILSDDNTSTAPVIAHALEWCELNGINTKYACGIYATAPFLKQEFLHAGYQTLTQYQCSSVYPVTTYSFPILRSQKIRKDGSLALNWPEYEMTRSQDLAESYHDAGQFYWLDCKAFKQRARLYNDDSRPVVLPRKFVQDIDSEEDWEIAEAMYQVLNQSKM